MHCGIGVNSEEPVSAHFKNRKSIFSPNCLAGWLEGALSFGSSSSIRIWGVPPKRYQKGKVGKGKDGDSWEFRKVSPLAAAAQN